MNWELTIAGIALVASIFSIAFSYFRTRKSDKEKIDTTTPTGKLFFTITAGIVEYERDLLLQRQREGIAAAQKAGKRFGRKKALSDDQVADIRARVSVGQQKSLIAAEYGISPVIPGQILSY